jgi:hypothetical protein
MIGAGPAPAKSVRLSSAERERVEKLAESRDSATARWARAVLGEAARPGGADKSRAEVGDYERYLGEIAMNHSDPARRLAAERVLGQLKEGSR